MEKYTASETARLLGIHRQTLILWIKKGWVKPKRDYRDWPVFTDQCIKKIQAWRNQLKDT